MFDQHVTFLYASDLSVSAKFYSEKLGLELVLDQGPCQIFRIAGEAFLGICQCSEARPASPKGVIVTFVSQDVDGWYERLRAKGVTTDGPPKLNPRYNIYHLFLKDPDGYTLEIQTFKDPAWPAPNVESSGVLSSK